MALGVLDPVQRRPARRPSTPRAGCWSSGDASYTQLSPKLYGMTSGGTTPYGAAHDEERRADGGRGPPRASAPRAPARRTAHAPSPSPGTARPGRTSRTPAPTTGSGAMRATNSWCSPLTVDHPGGVEQHRLARHAVGLRADLSDSTTGSLPSGRVAVSQSCEPARLVGPRRLRRDASGRAAAVSVVPHRMSPLCRPPERVEVSRGNVSRR